MRNHDLRGLQDQQLERRAQTARRLFLAYLVLWIFEGALRRWVVPDQQELLYFVRVPIVALIVGNAMRYRGGRVPVAGAGALAVLAALVLFDAAHIAQGAPTTTSILGLRLYVEPWLVPLCLAADLRRKDALDALRVICALAVPLALLALIQVNSPRTAFVNRIFASDGSDNFGLVAGSIRATSTFSASAGHAIFALLSVGAVVALYLSPRRRFDRLLTLVGGVSAALIVATAGSRTAVLGSALALVVLVGTVAYRDPSRLPRILGGSAVLAVVGWNAGKALAPQQIQGIIERFSYTGAQGEIGTRSIGAYTDWIGRISEPPLFGLGLGGQSQGLTNFGTSGAFVEGELIRQLFELGPPLFVVALALRAGACAYLIRGSLRRLRAGDPTPVALLSVSFSTLLAGPATGQGTIAGFTAIVGALILALLLHPESPTSEELPVHRRVLDR